jgi:hypothetical protein
MKQERVIEATFAFEGRVEMTKAASINLGQAYLSLRVLTYG